MDERGGAAQKLETHQQLFKVLEALNRVSHGLQPSRRSPDSDSSAIKALVELRTASSLIFSANPHMVSLSQHLSELIELVQELQDSKPSSHGLKSFLIRRVKSHEISRLAASIESELHAWIDRETVSSLTKTVAAMRYSREASLTIPPSSDEDKLFDRITVLQDRLSRAFDMNLQDLLLKSGIFSELEWRESIGVNGFLCSLQVLSSLIKAIKSPLVDEMESCGGILKIIGYLSLSDDLERRIMATDCAMEIGFFGRKQAVESMLNGGLIKRLVELQRSELGGDLIDMGKESEYESVVVDGKCREMKYLERHPFASCVARFAVQLEVGEGLRQREKRAFKQQILKKVRKACASDAEYATIVAEVLWGSSP
ncbi:hypothetical protein Pfo_000561 [Paulownia fortunei]|nr:hypothetical protein Pfo_000561 [Paulownia fortunei]